MTTDPLRDALESMRQVHARHDLGHRVGSWRHACALCEAYTGVAALAAAETPALDVERLAAAIFDTVGTCDYEGKWLDSDTAAARILARLSERGG